MFALPKLPYAKNALEPHLSEATLSFHHGEHHKAYIDKLNDLLRNDPLSNANLTDVILQSHGDAAKQAIFNNAAQCWNHEFLWNSMAPDGGGPATGAIKRLIDENFGIKRRLAKRSRKLPSAILDQVGYGLSSTAINLKS
jgi:superoxide dismutase, Fe-Mn family